MILQLALTPFELRKRNTLLAWIQQVPINGEVSGRRSRGSQECIACSYRRDCVSRKFQCNCRSRKCNWRVSITERNIGTTQSSRHFAWRINQRGIIVRRVGNAIVGDRVSQHLQITGVGRPNVSTLLGARIDEGDRPPVESIRWGQRPVVGWAAVPTCPSLRPNAFGSDDNRSGTPAGDRASCAH